MPLILSDLIYRISVVYFLIFDNIYDKTRYKIKHNSSCKCHLIYVIQSEERLTRYRFFVFASTYRLLYIIPVRRTGFIPYVTQNSIAKITDPF